MNKKQLWDSILQQAISGKLAPQLDSEPAVEQISPEPDKDDVPFKLPEKWQWVRMEDIVTVQPKVTVNDDEQLVSFVPMEKVSQGFNNDIDLSLAKPWRDVKNNYSRFADGDVIFAKITPCFQNRKSAIVDNTVNGIGCGSTEFITLRCSNLIFNKYLLWFVKCPYFINLGQSKFRGTAGQQRFAPKDVKNCLVPLPPLEEQRRIVAKLDELKPLVNQFGEAHDKLSELEADFPRKLKASILQAAMQGKLVPQLNNEPAVEQIGPALDPDDVPFELPEKWTWSYLQYLVFFINGDRSKNYPSKDKLITSNTGNPFVSAANLENNIISDRNLLFLSDEQFNLLRSGQILNGDILLCIRGSLGKFAIATRTGGAIASSLVILRLKDINVVSLDYLQYYLKSQVFIEEIKNYQNGTCQPNLAAKAVANFKIPLPPIEEQRRIVERIEQLFAEVDKMSACKAP